MSLYNTTLYGNGLFRQDASTNMAQAKLIAESGFTTVILFSLHVQCDGNFHYGNSPLVTDGHFNKTQFETLPSLVASLKGSVERVLFSIGSADVHDWAHIKTYLASTDGTAVLSRNFDALLSSLKLDGFDFDLEEFPLSEYSDSVVELTSMLHTRYQSIVTYCPFENKDFWLDCLAGSFSANGNKQPVSAFNLQCYGGGEDNKPSDWIDGIQSYSKPLGIGDSNAFVIPGYSVFTKLDTYASPSDICGDFSKLATGGGFLWNSGYIFGSQWTPKDYADAIVNGLERRC